MSTRPTRLYLKHPSNFFNPNSEEMQPIFDEVGLTTETTLKRQRTQAIRNNLVDAALLFTLRRPMHQRSPAHAYPHLPYTKAVLEEAPDLHGHKTKSRWQAFTGHLQDFAVRSEARQLISDGISNYYTNIARLTTRLPDAGDTIWVPVYPKTPEDTDPMSVIGVLPRRIAGNGHYRDRSDGGRLYFNMTEIASYIGWTIPGLETEETKTAVIDKLTSVDNSEGAIDPLALFKLGTVAVGGQEVRASEVFGGH